jgi:hypothetical protein
VAVTDEAVAPFAATAAGDGVTVTVSDGVVSVIVAVALCPSWASFTVMTQLPVVDDEVYTTVA